MMSVRRVLSEPGTPYGRLTLAGLLGLASAAGTIGLLAGSGYVIGRAALRPGLSALVGILAAVEVLAFARGPLRYAERLVGHSAALRALTQWRLWLYDRLAARVPSAFADWRSGDLLARAIDDVDALTDLYLRTLLPVVVAVGTAALATTLVGCILPWAALALGLPLLLALVLPSLLLWRQGDQGAGALEGELSAQVVDLLHGAPDLLAFGADRAALDRIEEQGRLAAKAERRQAVGSAIATLAAQLCLAAAVIAVLALAVIAVHDHQLGRVMVAVLPLAVLAAFEPVPQVHQAVTRALAVDSAAGRLLALDDVPVPVVDSDLAEPLTTGAVPALSWAGASLRYAPHLPLALDDVSLTLAPGSRLAVTGSSGAGKSSLINALLRFWPLTSGTQTLDGTDVERLRQADVRSSYALADQAAHLFAGTLRANLTLGRPEATAVEVAEALAAAQLTEWVAGLPEGLDTPVGDEGVALSGGERRRVAVARALIGGGPILLLDEPTSGLQEELAAQLIKDVPGAAGTRRVLLVTHRAAEAHACGSVLTLECGAALGGGCGGKHVPPTTGGQDDNATSGRGRGVARRRLRAAGHLRATGDRWPRGAGPAHAPQGGRDTGRPVARR
jgi:ATP-binding cassette, subfamily C, bacterial CydC